MTQYPLNPETPPIPVPRGDSVHPALVLALPLLLRCLQQFEVLARERGVLLGEAAGLRCEHLHLLH